jgi:malate dehydrogenase (oxaloacetate-decarboxylating)
MSHTVRDWMSVPAIFVDPDASVAHATTLMRRRNIHSLVVALENGGHGIITTTDIRDKIVGMDRDPKKTRIREIMSSPVVTAGPDWSLKQCSLKMQSINVHHLPVADDGGAIIGMISATDIFQAVEEIGWEAHY